MLSCFLVVKQSTWDHSGQGSESKIMTSFWSMWKMFCDVQVKMKFNSDQGDPDTLDDVRMGGFKHQFQLVSHSCAFGIAMPDGRMLSEKIFLRSRKIRVQDFHTNSCEEHVHISHCGVRRIGYTGLGEIMQNIAWELDVLRVIAENNFVEEDKPKNCACAIKLLLG